MTTAEKKVEIWRELSDVRANLINARVTTANLDEDNPDVVAHIRTATQSVEAAMRDLDIREAIEDAEDSE